MRGDLPAGWDTALPTYTKDSKHEATRKYSAHALEVITKTLPELVGGSGDLTESNCTKVEGNKEDFSAATPEGR